MADAPRFQYHGLMLDTARHWFSVPGILRQFDAMAAAKMNTLHWHITDANSMPIESKLFPLLSKKGAYAESMVYSQDQIKEIVDYGRYRGVRVVPEFDIPGHADAWAPGAPADVMVLCKGHGPFLAMFDATSPATYQFLDAFIGEMAGLFPDSVMHLGGECTLLTNKDVVAWCNTSPYTPYTPYTACRNTLALYSTLQHPHLMLQQVTRSVPHATTRAPPYRPGSRTTHT